MCKLNDDLCEYKVSRNIYLTCDKSKSIKTQIIGSIYQPINIQDLRNLDLNELIIGELNYYQSLVLYNQLGVQEIEANFIITSDYCYNENNLQFQISLSQSI